MGYGEEYYRSEFNLSMKLPIAWCAPECINFLRFTSSSDVWAYGVFLWEVFTYGQTPWEGISGSQVFLNYFFLLFSKFYRYFMQWILND